MTCFRIPEGGAQLLDSRLKEVANHTRQLSRKKVPCLDIPEVQEAPKLEENTTMCLEISQNEDLLLGENNVDSVNTTILNEHECSTKSDTVKGNSSIETDIVDSSETSKEEDHTTPNNSPSSSTEENVQNNIEEVFIEQPDLSSTPNATHSLRVSKDSQGSDQKTSENTAVRLGSTLESVNHNVRQTKRTILPYESILTHFKVPRWVLLF